MIHVHFAIAASGSNFQQILVQCLAPVTPSWTMYDEQYISDPISNADISCDNSQHTPAASRSQIFILPDTQG